MSTPSDPVQEQQRYTHDEENGDSQFHERDSHDNRIVNKPPTTRLMSLIYRFMDDTWEVTLISLWNNK